MKQTKCEGREQVDKELKRIIGFGGEGLMIREPKSQYEHTRSKTLLKIKTFYDAEVSILYWSFLNFDLTQQMSDIII